MKKFLCRVLYVVSVIPGIVDTVKGIIQGVRKGLADIKEAEQKAAFKKANDGNGQD